MMNRKLMLSLFLFASLQVLVFTKDWTTVTVRNSAGYIARFEVSYILNGPDVITEKSGNFPLGDSKSIILPPEADLIVMKVENLVWQGEWSTIFILNLTDNTSVCFTLTGNDQYLKEMAFCQSLYFFNSKGTTLQPKWKQNQC